MFRKLLLAVVAFVLTMGLALAQVDVNKADQAALDGVKGIGPVLSKSIIDARTKGGNFKDWADFEQRVKGVGDKSSSNLSQAGLTVNGQAKPNAPAAKASKPVAQTAPVAPKAAPAAARTETKADAKPAKKATADATPTEPKK